MTTPEETGQAETAESEQSEETPTEPSHGKALQIQRPRSEGQMLRFSHLKGKMVPA